MLIETFESIIQVLHICCQTLSISVEALEFMFQFVNDMMRFITRAHEACRHVICRRRAREALAYKRQ